MDGSGAWFSRFSSSTDNLCPDSEFMFHDLLCVLQFVEPVIPALHTFRRGVGGVFPAVCPAHLVALALPSGRCNSSRVSAYRMHWSMVFISRNFQLSPLAAERYSRVPMPFLLDLLFRRRQDVPDRGQHRSRRWPAGGPAGRRHSGEASCRPES